MYFFNQESHSDTCWTSHGKHKGQAIAHKRPLFKIVWLQYQNAIQAKVVFNLDHLSNPICSTAIQTVALDGSAGRV